MTGGARLGAREHNWMMGTGERAMVFVQSGRIWLVFAVIFLLLFFFHIYWAFQTMPEFVLPERPLARFGSAQVLGMDIDKPLKDFADAFNQYVKSQNNSSRNQNLLSGGGYIVAFLTALASFIDIHRRENNASIKQRDEATPPSDEGDHETEGEIEKVRNEPKQIEAHDTNTPNDKQKPPNIIPG
jgi:hypothetical protein